MTVQDYWESISMRFDEWTPPLRPTVEDVELFRNQLQGFSRTLLLGATKELKPLVAVAVDQNPLLDAIVADWSNLPFENEFDAVIGDGSLNVFQGTPDVFYAQAYKALKKNGRLILRLYIRPEIKEDLSTVLENKENLSFHAFKWRVAQTLATPYVPVKEIYKVMHPICDHPTLSLYPESDQVYYFPKLSEIPAFDHIQFPLTYELASRCPIITWHKD